jgi:hypothetical protein
MKNTQRWIEAYVSNLTRGSMVGKIVNSFTLAFQLPVVIFKDVLSMIGVK